MLGSPAGGTLGAAGEGSGSRTVPTPGSSLAPADILSGLEGGLKTQRLQPGPLLSRAQASLQVSEPHHSTLEKLGLCLSLARNRGGGGQWWGREWGSGNSQNDAQVVLSDKLECVVPHQACISPLPLPIM